jgi:hypothetical protein
VTKAGRRRARRAPPDCPSARHPPTGRGPEGAAFGPCRSVRTCFASRWLGATWRQHAGGPETAPPRSLRHSVAARSRVLVSFSKRERQVGSGRLSLGRANASVRRRRPSLPQSARSNTLAMANGDCRCGWLRTSSATSSPASWWVVDLDRVPDRDAIEGARVRGRERVRVAGAVVGDRRGRRVRDASPLAVLAAREGARAPPRGARPMIDPTR